MTDVEENENIKKNFASVKDDFKYQYHGVKMYRKFSTAV